MPHPNFHHHTDRGALHEALTAQLARSCTDALAARGNAWLALAGGGTPLPAYARWAMQAFEWPCIHAVPTDERQVPHDHAHSNIAAFRHALLPASGVCLHALVDADGALAASPALPEGAFDLVVLGMGVDGHIASIFPEGDGMAEALAVDAPPALATRPAPLPPEAPHARVTLSLARLLDARSIVLVIAGQDKLDTLQSAHARGLPVAALIDNAGERLAIHWSP